MIRRLINYIFKKPHDNLCAIIESGFYGKSNTNDSKGVLV